MKNTVACHAVLYYDDKILIVRRSKTDLKRPLEWDLPGGIAEEGEMPAEACSREVKEETGITINPQDLRLVFALTKFFQGNNNNVTWLIYLGESKKLDIKLSFEHDKYEWVELNEAIDRINYPRFKNALKHIREHHLIPPQK